MSFVYGAVTRCGGRFQGLRLRTSLVTPWRRCSPPVGSRDPEATTPTRCHVTSV